MPTCIRKKKISESRLGSELPRVFEFPFSWCQSFRGRGMSPKSPRLPESEPEGSPSPPAQGPPPEPCPRSEEEVAGRRSCPLTFKGGRPEELQLHALELLPLPLQLPLNGVRNSIHKMEARMSPPSRLLPEVSGFTISFISGSEGGRAGRGWHLTGWLHYSVLEVGCQSCGME